jgi:hypothetical protein
VKVNNSVIHHRCKENNFCMNWTSWMNL